MKLIYITEGVGPVFQSQVVELLNALVNSDEIEQITLLVGIRDEKQKKEVLHLNKDIKLLFFKSVPLYPIVDFVTKHTLQNVLEDLAITSNTIIHTRGEYLGILSYKIMKKLYASEVKILIDVRGAALEEISMYMKQSIVIKIKLIYLNYLYSKYITKSSLCNAVTTELKNLLVNNYAIDNEKVIVNHCIAGNNFSFNEPVREETRKELGIQNDEILFIFSTSSNGGKWQNGDQIAISLANQGYKVLMLSKKQYNIKGVISKYVAYEDVPKYLMAADIGIIIRDKDIVNKVASPIKFSEYLSCGLPVIANNSVDLISRTIKEYNCGMSIDDLENINNDSISKLTQLDRKEISDVGHQLFSSETIVRGYLDTYSILNKTNKMNIMKKEEI